jgi:hypothetical protein
MRRVSEVSFWRNYFYRVSLIKQQSTIKSMSRENTQTSLQDTKPSRPETASLSAPVTEHHDLLDSTPPKPVCVGGCSAADAISLRFDGYIRKIIIVAFCKLFSFIGILCFRCYNYCIWNQKFCI